ncbi:hypothetical protein INS49_000641 [Diaporthe citri]|uniref:uncharacterized protein n=1 Tax=Diaporthe citri TaxID=83186 RepID=UPI001C825C26|nr:uncharacterized protein INS49_000641 [Diaporthe citri]KAG6366464.1 hypothetical protein INS49_000641 [Diaporthe citri]
MIQVTPREFLIEKADSLDEGSKDTLATHPSLGLGTTAGSLSLMGSKPRKNSRVVEMLLASGAVILGKANLSEFSNSRGSMMPSGWSAVGGQTQSAYVRGGLDPNDTKDGHSSFWIVFWFSTGRAALYTIKPSIGLVPQAGIVPMSSHFDSAGPMTKSVYDLAILLDAISEKDPTWMFPVSSIKPVPMASEQICEDITNAHEVVKGKAKSFAANVPLPSIEGFKLNGTYSDVVAARADLKKELNAYLQDLEESQVRTLQDIIDFNTEHATEELPTHHPRQDEFLKAQEQQTSPKDYEEHLAHLRRAATIDGIDHILDEYGLDVIIGPADSFITSFATGSGYPIAAMPLSYLRFNGRPLGVAAIARKNQEALLVKNGHQQKIMSYLMGLPCMFHPRSASSKFGLPSGNFD